MAKRASEKGGAIDSARRFAEANGAEMAHAEQVCATSLALFDATRGLHGLGKRARLLLEAAALMHDTGLATRPAEHHKGSRDLILASDLETFSRREIKIMACVARYHRGPYPGKEHKVYADLDAKSQAIVNALAAILRVADGLDRSHISSAKSLRVERDKDAIRLYVKQQPPCLEDIAGAIRKSGLFADVFGVTLDILPE